MKIKMRLLTYSLPYKYTVAKLYNFSILHILFNNL